MAKYGIIVDLDRCTGCMTCVIACKQENLTRPSVWWNKILELESESLDRITYVRHACMHCENPPCLYSCPNDAIYQHPDGIVLISHQKCGGAGDCVDACPYAVRTRKGTPPPAPAGQSRQLHTLRPSNRSRTGTGLR